MMWVDNAPGEPREEDGLPGRQDKLEAYLPLRTPYRSIRSAGIPDRGLNIEFHLVSATDP